MADEIKVGMIGLDTSHSVEFTRRMQAPDCPQEQKVAGMRVTACMRFETPFQDKDGLDKRQETLESWGVKVVESFEAAVADCDAVMIEINDAAFHLDYFRKCVELGKPVFLDKPLADTMDAGREIAALAKARNIPFMSCSSLRFVSDLIQVCERVPDPMRTSIFGPLGKAPAGSSIVWYGVHAFEMLERAMGRGARTVNTVADDVGVVCLVAYDNGRRGVVELTEGQYFYGGALRGNGKAEAFIANMKLAYTLQLRDIHSFFRTGTAPLAIEDTLEVMAMLAAAQESFDSGKPVSPARD